MESYAGYKRTELVTYKYGKTRRVYQCEGKLYYRMEGMWFGVFRENCYSRA